MSPASNSRSHTYGECGEYHQSVSEYLPPLIITAIAVLLAWPLAYWSMSLWLETFAYHADMAWWLFGLGSALVLACAMLAVVALALLDLL